MNVRALLVASWCLASAAVPAHQGEHGVVNPGTPSSISEVAVAAPGPKEKAARLYFTDSRLTTQRGKEVEFFSDVLKDRVVLINFFFTSCPDSCPLQSSKLAEVQARLGGLAGKEIHLISISVDPEKDTPEELEKYAGHFNAANGWTFLTGKKESVDVVVRRLG